MAISEIPGVTNVDIASGIVSNFTQEIWSVGFNLRSYSLVELKRRRDRLHVVMQKSISRPWVVRPLLQRICQLELTLNNALDGGRREGRNVMWSECLWWKLIRLWFRRRKKTCITSWGLRWWGLANSFTWTVLNEAGGVLVDRSIERAFELKKVGFSCSCASHARRSG